MESSTAGINPARNTLKEVIDRSSRLITKLETTIRGEKDVLKDKIFVAIDEDEIDIGKVTPSNTIDVTNDVLKEVEKILQKDWKYSGIMSYNK